MASLPTPSYDSQMLTKVPWEAKLSLMETTVLDMGYSNCLPGSGQVGLLSDIVTQITLIHKTVIPKTSFSAQS